MNPFYVQWIKDFSICAIIPIVVVLIFGPISCIGVNDREGQKKVAIIAGFALVLIWVLIAGATIPSNITPESYRAELPGVGK